MLLCTKKIHHRVCCGIVVWSWSSKFVFDFFCYCSWLFIGIFSQWHSHSQKSTLTFSYGTPSAHLDVSGQSRCTVYSALSPVNGSEINHYWFWVVRCYCSKRNCESIKFLFFLCYIHFIWKVSAGIASKPAALFFPYKPQSCVSDFCHRQETSQQPPSLQLITWRLLAVCFCCLVFLPPYFHALLNVLPFGWIDIVEIIDCNSVIWIGLRSCRITFITFYIPLIQIGL